MYNGNVEKPLWRLLATRDPHENILAWQRRTRDKWTERMPQVAAEFPDLPIVRLRHPHETERWMRRLGDPR